MNINDYNSFHSSLGKLIKQQQTLVDMVAKSYTSDQHARLINNLKSITPALTSIINSSAYQQLVASSSRLSEVINKNLSMPLINITNSTYDTLLKSDFSALKTLQKTISNLNISDINFDNLDFNENGNITYESEIFTPEQINSATSELVLKASTGTIDYSDIKEHPISSVSFLLICYIIFTLIIPDIYSIIKKYIKENYLNNKNTITEKDYNNFRIVTVETLNIKSKPFTNSDIIGKLHYLNVVKIIETCPYWLKIEYKDSTNKIQLTGWISKKNTVDFSQEAKNLLNLKNN